MASFKDDYDRFYCKYCDVTVKKNPAAMNQHLLGNRHKRNVALFLKKMRIKNKEEEYAKRENQKELRRIQAITGIQICTQSAPIPTPSNSAISRPPPGKVRVLQEEPEDPLEESINEAIDEAVMHINEIDIDDYCKAAEVYYLKMNGNSKEGLEDFIKAARKYIINDIDAKSVENGEAAPNVGEWTTVEIVEEKSNIMSNGIHKRSNSILKNNEDENENEMDEADAIFGTVGMNGTAQPRRPVGYRSLYEDEDEVTSEKNEKSSAFVKTEDDKEENISGLFKKKKKRGGSAMLRK